MTLDTDLPKFTSTALPIPVRNQVRRNVNYITYLIISFMIHITKILLKTIILARMGFDV